MRPRLLLFLAPYEQPARNAVAATLAWLSKRTGSLFEVYYDAVQLGRHLGSDPRLDGHAGGDVPVGLLTGGLVSGGRHHEALMMSLLRFETTVLTWGSSVFGGPLAALAEGGRAEVIEFSSDAISELYDWAFARFATPWPAEALLINRSPSAALRDVDAYLYPEIFYRERLGLENSIADDQLRTMARRGLRRIAVAGIGAQRQTELRELGFDVVDSGLLQGGDDYASVSTRLAQRWKEKRRGWIMGDPTLTSYWLPTACREDRIAIYGVPQAKVLDSLAAEIASSPVTPVLGRQSDDSDFFTLSRLGQSLQVVDPCRPPLPVLSTVPARWPTENRLPPDEDPPDEQLRQWASEGRILTSLVFWTGMIREIENLYALSDLIALTGLKAGLVVTAQTFAWRPSPLDLLLVPREHGGLHPLVELLMGSSGDGVSIESLLAPETLGAHLAAAQRELDRLAVPQALRPRGWWATMDAPLLPRGGRQRPARVRLNRAAPFKVQVRFHRHSPVSELAVNVSGLSNGNGQRESLRSQLGRRIRSARLDGLFLPYRPYDEFAPGSLDPALAGVVRSAGYAYMLTKSAFGRGPTVAYREDDFVAINSTSGQWDGWTPFETVNDIADLRRAERSLASSGRPGWLLGQIDSCLWTFSGELWDRAPRLRAVAEFVARGGASGKLINVRPGVVARYARLVSDTLPALMRR